MRESQGYLLLEKFLRDRVKEDFVDPQHFTDNEAELRAYRVTNLMKKLTVEILEWVNVNVERAKYLRLKEQGDIEQKDFNIG